MKKTTPNKNITAAVRFEEIEMEKIDAEAYDEGLSRSDIIRRIVRRHNKAKELTTQ